MSARKVYEQARSQLVQIRTVLKGQASQTSVGSGFVVTTEGHIVTNFHVVSEVALKPDRHDLVYVTADGREAPVQVLMLDVLHDLALLKRRASQPAAYDALPFAPKHQPLAQGERMYSLGNPLDVGFAVIEGNYNGLVERSFYPQIFFAGSLSAGMSGGPALDQEGRVIGINVARRVDGEQVSFLVPACFATALLTRGRDAPPINGPAYGHRRRAADGAPGAARPSASWSRAGRAPPTRATRCRCRPTASCAAGARASRRAPAASISSAPTA